MTTGKTIALIIWTFVSKVMSLPFNMLSRFVIAFLPMSKHLLIAWLQSPSAVIGAQESKICHCFCFFPFYLPWSDGTGCHDLVFWMLSFKPAFSLSSLTLIGCQDRIAQKPRYRAHWWVHCWGYGARTHGKSRCLGVSWLPHQGEWLITGDPASEAAGTHLLSQHGESHVLIYRKPSAGKMEVIVSLKAFL